jgi:magnesium-transporting ATPase (P-type)
MLCHQYIYTAMLSMYSTRGDNNKRYYSNNFDKVQYCSYAQTYVSEFVTPILQQFFLCSAYTFVFDNFSIVISFISLPTLFCFCILIQFLSICSYKHNSTILHCLSFTVFNTAVVLQIYPQSHEY